MKNRMESNCERIARNMRTLNANISMTCGNCGYRGFGFKVKHICDRHDQLTKLYICPKCGFVN